MAIVFCVISVKERYGIWGSMGAAGIAGLCSVIGTRLLDKKTP